MESIVDSYLYEIQLEQYVEERVDQLILEGWTIDKLKSAGEKNVKVMNNWLMKNGINVNAVLSKLKSNEQKFKSIIMKGYKQGDNPKDVVEKLQSFMQKIIEKVVLMVKTYIEKMKGDSVLHRLLQANAGLYALIVIAIINTFLHSVGSKIGGPVGWIFESVVAGPMIEEMAKQASIMAEAPFIITGVWTGFEFGLYVKSAIGAGLSVPKAIIMRLSTFLMHMTTLFLQKFFKEKWKDSKYANWMSLTGFFLAVAIHAWWNNTNTVRNIFNKYGYNIKLD